MSVKKSSKEKKFGIHWLSNAPWCPTGYGNQTKLFLQRIADLGYDMSMTAFWGLEGGKLTINESMPVYARGFDPFGNDIVNANAQAEGADIIISLMDAWVCSPENIQKKGVKWIPWFPIDMHPLSVIVYEKVKEAFASIVMSEHGSKMMMEKGLDHYYVPHGIDTKIFAPIDREKARELHKAPKDAFVVGMVAANKGNPSRKAFVPNLKAFAMLKKKHPDALLYLHTHIGTEMAGVDLLAYIEDLGLKPVTDVVICDQYQNMYGFTDSYMNDLYNIMDVHLLASMGEGFGIPIVESQAAGTPVIVGDWTSMPELCFAGWKIPRNRAEAYYTPHLAYQFNPHPEAVYEALEQAYQNKGNDELRNLARTGAMDYDVDVITEKYWKPVLADIKEYVRNGRPSKVSSPIRKASKVASGTRDSKRNQGSKKKSRRVRKTKKVKK